MIWKTYKYTIFLVRTQDQGTPGVALMAGQNTGGLARMKQVRRILDEGGLVRFNWRVGWTRVFSANGLYVTTLDGRTYSAFLRTLAPKLERSETGSVETKDLVVEWRKP
jgi:hypothetical protein